jgi:hypothetical protein
MSTDNIKNTPTEFIRHCRLDDTVSIRHITAQVFLNAEEGSDFNKRMRGRMASGQSREEAAASLAGFYWSDCAPFHGLEGPFMTADDAENAATEDYDMDEVERLLNGAVVWLDDHDKFFWTPDEDNGKSTNLTGPFATIEQARESAKFAAPAKPPNNDPEPGQKYFVVTGRRCDQEDPDSVITQIFEADSAKEAVSLFEDRLYEHSDEEYRGKVIEDYGGLIAICSVVEASGDIPKNLPPESWCEDTPINSEPLPKEKKDGAKAAARQ